MGQYLSPYLVAIVVAWVAAQGAKYLVYSIKARSLSAFRQLYLSGNMPSAHSASVVSLVVVIGFRDGINSALFGLAALFAAIVMYDAMMVRRAAGEQGLVLHRLLTEQKSIIPLPYAATGHRPLEVLVGAGLGAIIGAVVFLATK